MILKQLQGLEERTPSIESPEIGSNSAISRDPSFQRLFTVESDLRKTKFIK